MRSGFFSLLAFLLLSLFLHIFQVFRSDSVLSLSQFSLFFPQSTFAPCLTPLPPY